MSQFYYYLYLIKFNDGRYYIGSRKCKCRPEQDTKYMGSPVTFKELWSDSNLSKKKHILKEVSSSEELRKIEPKLIKAAWERDGRDICLNRHAAPHFHPEVCYANGKKSYELGLGVHALSKEEKSKLGKRIHELGLGVHGLSKEQQSINGRKGGKKIAERYSREFALVDPNGNVHRERNLRKFCREHELIRPNVQAVLRGERSSHHGWTRYNEEFSI